MDADVVGQILRDVSDYKEQLRLSTVCKEWSLVCKSLPKLSILLPSTVSERAGQILEKAMQGRSNLRKLYFSVWKEGRIVLWEEDFFDVVPTSIEKFMGLDLNKLTFFGWKRFAGFPKLLHLQIRVETIIESPGSLIFPNLKLLQLFSTKSNLPGSVLGEIIRSCPSLEDCNAGRLEGPVHLKSNSLVHLTLWSDDSAPETVIEACNLTLLNTSRSFVLRAGNVWSCADIPPLHQLKVLILMYPNVLDLPKLLCLSSLKHLVIWMDRIETVTLQQFVPQQLEVLCFHTMRAITADDMFRKATKTEILALLHGPADNLPCFPCVKSVVLRFRERDEPQEWVLPVLVQLLRCSPRLEHLTLEAANFDHLPRELLVDTRLHLQCPLDERNLGLLYPSVKSYALYQ